jgi:DNA helicase HerA-like ATPase
MRANPAIDIETAILELGVGEALVSLLDEKGIPSITERAWMFAPGSQIGPITPDERKSLIQQSVVAGVYEKEVDRESAFEKPAGCSNNAAAPTTDGGWRRTGWLTRAAPFREA